jgi:transcriptional regulator with XRE-family HTH domain
MADIAGACNLSIGFISQVERGISTPSMTSLFKIARALKTTPEELLRLPEKYNSVSKKSYRMPFSLGVPERKYERLGPGFAGALMHATLIHRPHDAQSETIVSICEEFGYIMSGTVEYLINGETHLLETGDAIHVDKGMSYSSKVLSTDGAKELWVASYPKTE